jgi:hypothetical protein
MIKKQPNMNKSQRKEDLIKLLTNYKNTIEPEHYKSMFPVKHFILSKLKQKDGNVKKNF